MANVYSDIAIRPDVAGYPIVNQQTSSSGGSADDAADAAHFQQILDNLAAQAKGQTQSQAPAQGANFALTKASGWAPRSTASAAATSGGSTHSFKNFMKNVWDVVNPLQHIPVVSSIYRHVTGDTISAGAHFAGDALYGGPIGGAIAAIDIAYQKSTGKDMGETVIASLTGRHGSSSPSGTAPADTMVAQNLTQITPAAGNAPVHARAGKNIIWSDNNSTPQSIIPTSGSPLFPPSGTIGEGSALPSPAQPVLQANSAASTGAVQTQEAPAGAARKAVSPELIVSRMMDGLQKYAQMKQQDLNPQLSGLY